MKYIFLIFILTACAATPGDPCTQQCNPVFDSCMDAGANMRSTHALEMLEAQCAAGQQACVNACRQDSQPR